MQVFAKVADSGSFAVAARALNMSPPAVTRAIAGLEDLIGTRLLIRTTRRVSLTEAGQRYAQECRRILAEIDEAEAAAAGAYAKPTGGLTVTASILFGQIYVLPIMTEYLDRHQAVSGRLLLLDRIVNMVEDGIDVAIRIGPLADSELSAIKVGTVRRIICGAPAYFGKHGLPQRPEDLKGHSIIATTGSSAPQEWRFGQRPQSMTLPARLACSTNAASISAALSGWGLTRVLSYQVGEALADGRLQVVLADFEEPPLPIHVVHVEGRRTAAKVRAFVDLAVERLRANRLING
ncbi:MAG TPA: LysR family transcriptional regulator [Stellaceae bacterium]|jgi:DNA-binding transcriptional LysR family regulator|nr:LysR family transcriptional regulator [Stellaceae bacterium]